MAIVVCLWFGLGIRQAQKLGAATALIANQPPTPASSLRHAPSLLDAASILNPDEEVSILRGRLALAEHHSGSAERILAGVTRREPRNLEAWIWLAGAALNDPRTAAIALAQIHALDPRS
ncbi:MAG: hypothetical protein ACR2JH_11575 [Solirubrobacteraceae bacterium]